MNDHSLTVMAHTLEKLTNINRTATGKNIHFKQEMIESNFAIGNSYITIKQEEFNIKEETPVIEHELNIPFINQPSGASSVTAIKQEKLYEKEESLVIADETNKSRLCNLHDFKSTSESAIIDHAGTHSGDYVCSICQYRTAQKEALDTHISLHTGEMQYTCTVCGYQAKYKDKLIIHMRTHTGEKPYTCSVCEYRAAQKVNLIKHMKTHSGAKRFSCKYGAKMKRNAAAHMKTHTADQRHICTICCHEAAQEADLVEHMHIHKGETGYACSICEYQVEFKNKLIEHMRKHMGEKPYSCSICEYKAPQKSALTEHMASHTGEELYFCSICGYKAKSKCNLAAHASTHAREKPYSCSMCNYKSTYRQNLLKHIRFHTRERYYSCTICQYKAKIKSNLVAHIKTHRGEELPVKRAHKTLSLWEKMAILDELKCGVTQKAIALKYGIGTSTISDIKQKEDKIKWHLSNCLTGPGDRKTLKKSVFPEMEKKLYCWFLMQRNERIPMTSNILAEKALQFYKESYGDNGRFVASRGWICKFMKRHGLREFSRKKLSSKGDAVKPVTENLQKTSVAHEDALKSFNLCCMWANENNIDIADIVVLNKLKDMAFEKTKQFKTE